MKITLTVLLLSLLKFVSAQSVVYRGEKSYTATNEWAFDSKNVFSYNNLNVAVARVSLKSGYLMMSINVSFNFEHLGQTVLLYLENGKVLTLNRVSSDNVDDKSIALYGLTQSQITLLKQSSIGTIRYSIIEHGNKTNYTAENNGKTETITLSPDYKFDTKVPHNTAIDVAKLFSEDDE